MRNGAIYFVATLLAATLFLTGCGRVDQAKVEPGPSQEKVRDHPGTEAITFSSIRMIDQERGWALTKTSVLRTDSAGTMWTDVTPGVPSGMVLEASSFLDTDDGWLAYAQEGSAAVAVVSPVVTVLHTIDGGKHWTRCEVRTVEPHDTPMARSLDFVDANHGWLLVGYGVGMGSDYELVYRTVNGGASWLLVADAGPDQQTPDGLPFGGVKNGPAFLDRETGWMSGFDHGNAVWLYVTHDAGRTWRRQAIPIPLGYHTEGGSVETRPPLFFGSENGLLPVVFHAPGQPTIFYETQDEGKHWNPTAHLKSTVNNTFIWSFADMKHGFATDGEQLYATLDGGRSWQTVRADINLQEVTQLDFISERTGWMIDYGTLYMTTDGGHTWVVQTS